MIYKAYITGAAIVAKLAAKMWSSAAIKALEEEFHELDVHFALKKSAETNNFIHLYRLLAIVCYNK